MENSLSRLKKVGWKTVTTTTCGHGHIELVYGHKDYPGVFLIQSCTGEIERWSGEIVQVTKTEFIRHWMD